MSEAGGDTTVRAVEIGSVLPRHDDGGGIGIGRRSLLGAVGFVALAGVLWLLPWQSVRYLSVLPLLAGAGVLAVPLLGDDEEGLPNVPGVELRSFDEVDAECAADHLVGAYDGPPRGLPNSEVVIATVDHETANRLEEIPRECERRWRSTALQTVLVGVPRVDADELEGVAEAYDATLLVDDVDDVPSLLAYLPDVLAQAEGETISGVGSATVRRTAIDGRPPGSQALREDINKGQGKPLAHVAEVLRERSGHHPAVTLLAGPRKYLDDARRALESDADRIVSVCHGARRVDLVRFQLLDGMPDADALGPLTRRSIRATETDTEPERRGSGCERPADDAPLIDQSLEDGCEC